MAINFDDLETVTRSYGSDTFEFDKDLSAASFRLGQAPGPDDSFAAGLGGEGKSISFILYPDFKNDYLPAIYKLSSDNFDFADGSKILFANSDNGYATVLAGGKGDDLLVGSLPSEGTPLTRVSDADAAYSSPGAFTPEGRTLVLASGTEGGFADADMYLYDLMTGPVYLVSGSASEPTTHANWGASISNNGRGIVFSTSSPSLGAANGFSTVVYSDAKLPLGGSIVSGLNGAAPNGSSDSAMITDTGAATVFRSDASNLVTDDTNGRSDIYIVAGNGVERVSVSSNESQANGGSFEPSVSGDGRYVTFRSDASNLVAGDTNGVWDIFVRDRVAGTTTLVSRNADFRSQDPAISTDGKVVVFQSFDDFGLTGDTSGQHANLFAVQVANPRQITLVSADANGVAAGLHVDDYASGAKPSLSGDGRFVVFATDTRLVADDDDALQDIYVKDIVTGDVERLDAPEGVRSSSPVISADGSRIAFASASGEGGAWQTYAIDNPLFGALLSGGAGDDTYQIARAADVVIEREDAGNDLVSASVSYVLAANVENLELTGKARNATGNDLDNELTGNAAANRIDGGDGADLMTGGKGDDTYFVDERGDAIVEAARGGTDGVVSSISYRLSGALENLRLAGSGDTRATGNAAANVLVGNRGDNVFDGKAGDDRVSGGRGDDLFWLTSASGTDTLTDFVSTEESIKFDAGRLDLGDGDGRLEGAATRRGPGGFSAQSELVVFTNAVRGDLDSASAARAIGSASSAFDRGDHRIFVVDDGADTGIFLFTSSGHNSRVSASELSLLAVVQGTETVVGDYLFGA